MEYLHFYINEGTATLTTTYNETYVALQYSYNKTDWTTATTSTSIELVPDKKVYFKGNISGYIEDGNIINFQATGSPLYAGGSIMSLQNGNPDETTIKYPYEFKGLFQQCGTLVTPPILPAITLTEGCYKELFATCTSLVNAPELPATTLAIKCYSVMFSNCTSLKTAPTLPATTLAYNCYSSMFSGCTSLTTAPELTADKLSEFCYWAMFSGCTSLVNVPALPATTLAPKCYSYMFSGCTSLTTAPELPATTLADLCYYRMFKDCSNLINAPELPATTLSDSCYREMFYYCSSLVTAPELPATTLTYECYDCMFRNCASLTTASELPATTLANHCYSNMFRNCASLTTAPTVLPAYKLTIGCYSSMFAGCTSLANAPKIEADTLAERCCASMFSGCTSLVKAPELKAGRPAYDCYSYMFNNCSKLNYVKCVILEDYINSNNSPFSTNWLRGVASSGKFVKNRDTSISKWGRSYSGIPEGWTVINHTDEIFTITVTSNDSDHCSVSGEGSYKYETLITIECIPFPGYKFVQWNDGYTNAKRKVWVYSDETYIATVRKLYTVTLNGDNCTLIGAGNYGDGESVEISCVPLTGYEFVQWNDENTNATRTIIVTSDITYTATVRKLPKVTLNGDNCTLYGEGYYSSGTSVEISCVPDDLYEFVRWSDGNTNATRMITVTEDITLTAVTRAITSDILEIKARKGSGEYERNNIIWNIDYKGGTFSWDARVYTDFDNLTTNVEISDDRVTNISKGSSWIGDSRIYSYNMTVPRNDSDTNKEFTINISSTNRILSDSITIRVIQKPKLPVLIEDIFVSSGDVENALVTIPDTMGEVLVVYEGETLAKYTIDDCVSNYVLYYRNALGGIDLFPVTGKVIKSNDIEHLTINKKYDNRTLNFGKTNYENVLTERWQLYSGRLTDQQSKLMHHLINSTYVYLYDIQADKFTPVVITDTEMEYKTYKNNNNKMVYYTINVEASQTKYRR